MFLFLLALAGGLRASTDAPGRVDLDYRDAPLRYIIDQLIHGHGIPIVYQIKHVAYRRVTVACRACDVPAALDAILAETPLTWEKVGDQYVVRPDRAHWGRITGKLSRDEDGEPVSGARITLTPKESFGGRAMVLPAKIHCRTDGDGAFEFPNLPPGRYLLRAEAEGYAARSLSGVSVNRRKTVRLDLEMALAPLPLQEIVVTPGYYNMDNTQSLGKRVFGREEIQDAIYFSDDVFRVADHLPGVTSAELSGDFRIRGGHNTGALILFDGVELFDPFHLKGLGGGFSSVIDADNVARLELLTGGFPAEYGDRMNGVLNMVSAIPSVKLRTIAEIDLLGVKLKAEGRSGDGRAGFVVSGRDGNLTLDLDLANLERNIEIEAKFDDLYAKTYLFLGSRHYLAVNYLAANDGLSLFNQLQGPPVERFEATESEDHSDYYWLNFISQWTPDLSAHATLSLSRHESLLDLLDNHGDRRYIIDGYRDFESRSLRQDWRWKASERLFVKWGFQVKRERANYDYLNEREDLGSFLPRNVGVTDLSPAAESDSQALYLSGRVRVTDALTVETGLRYDRQSHLAASQLSPRIHAAYDIDAENAVKFGWGRFYQSQGVHELQVEDGVDQFWPAELAEHWGLGYDHLHYSGWEFRGELYYKRFMRIRPRFENFLDPQASQGELLSDRILIEADSGSARGIELTFKKRMNAWASSLSYALTKAEDVIDGETLPRQWDQRHGLSLAFSFKQKLWRFNFAWRWHSGWRVTDVGVVSVTDQHGVIGAQPTIGPLYGARLPNYHRLDLRVHRIVPLGRGRAMTLFLEMFNAYDRENVRGLDNQFVLLDAEGNAELSNDFGRWLPMVGTFGINFRF